MWLVLLVRVKVWTPEVAPRFVLPKSLVGGVRVVAGTTRTLPVYGVVPPSSSLTDPETGMDVPTWATVAAGQTMLLAALVTGGLAPQVKV